MPVRNTDQDRARAAALQTLIEELRKQQLGEEHSPFVDQYGGANFFDRLFSPESKGVYAAQQLLGGKQGLSPDDMLAFGQRYAPPGSEAYTNFANEISNIRTTQLLRQNPDLLKAMGITATTPEEMALKMGIASKAAAATDVRDVTQAPSQGYPSGGKTTSKINKATGEVTPIGGEMPQSNLATELGKLGINVEIPGEQGMTKLQIGSAEAAKGAETVKEEQQIRQQRDATIQMISVANALEKSLGETKGGKVLPGQIADITGKLKSFLTQVGGAARVTGIPGVDNISDLLNQYTNGAFDATALYGAKVDPMHFALATAYAQATNTSGVVSWRELQNALKATEDVRSGSPGMVKAALQSIIQLQADKVNRLAPRYKFDPIDLQKLAPSLFSDTETPAPTPTSAPAEPTAATPKKRAFTYGELKAMQKQQEGGQ